MIPTDTEIVGLMRKLYAPAPGDFDFISDPGTNDGVCFGVAQYPNVTALIFRGSMTKEDWFRDALSEIAAPGARIARAAELGMLPLGFDAGMLASMFRWGSYAKPALVIGGHSLGAARACIAAGLNLAYGGTVEKLVLCGCPRPGAPALAMYLEGVDIRSYRNLSDPVCDLPTDPPWCHVRPFIELSQPPAPGDISIFRDHHIGLYEAGVAAWEAAHP